MIFGWLSLNARILWRSGIVHAISSSSRTTRPPIRDDTEFLHLAVQTLLMCGGLQTRNVGNREEWEASESKGSFAYARPPSITSACARLHPWPPFTRPFGHLLVQQGSPDSRLPPGSQHCCFQQLTDRSRRCVQR